MLLDCSVAFRSELKVSFTVFKILKIIVTKKDVTQGSWILQPGLKGEADQIYTSSGSQNVSWNSNLSSGLNRPLTWYFY